MRRNVKGWGREAVNGLMACWRVGTVCRWCQLRDAGNWLGVSKWPAIGSLYIVLIKRKTLPDDDPSIWAGY